MTLHAVVMANIGSRRADLSYNSDPLVRKHLYASVAVYVEQNMHHDEPARQLYQKSCAGSHVCRAMTSVSKCQGADDSQQDTTSPVT